MYVRILCKCKRSVSINTLKYNTINMQTTAVECSIINYPPVCFVPITTTTSSTLYIFPRSTFHHGFNDSLVTLHSPQIPSPSTLPSTAFKPTALPLVELCLAGLPSAMFQLFPEIFTYVVLQNRNVYFTVDHS